MLLRADASAIGSLCQTPVVKAEDVLTSVLSRGYHICLDMKVGHSLSTCILVCITPSVVSSVVFVSIENGTRVMNEPDS